MVYELLPKMTDIFVFSTVVPPWADWGESLDLSSEQYYYDLTKFQLSRPYGLVCTIRFREEEEKSLQLQ